MLAHGAPVLSQAPVIFTLTSLFLNWRALLNIPSHPLQTLKTTLSCPIPRHNIATTFDQTGPRGSLKRYPNIGLTSSVSLALPNHTSTIWNRMGCQTKTTVPILIALLQDRRTVVPLSSQLSSVKHQARISLV
ncbi:uncharacterized protein ANIA_10655 [Aspergillus nidulans FGSC A4]|uniref:Uncharacterized protein n=1 Tax=Emericella nidulans (strain FGSC A4 / ATCC 38163 / CBS 112.46 / NRRL 194 / M139) TaxID=227321 RepID=C8VH33_EMENI|nr:hypothetical protein [Aspergillus nidulans FGSC A4]CBF82232.1 TPA: hypothetical protein ANIA_10655 [Aspergillus nidulans FGSC A4]